MNTPNVKTPETREELCEWLCLAIGHCFDPCDADYLLTRMSALGLVVVDKDKGLVI